MAVNCDPAALVAAAKCFQCIPPGMEKPVELYLLAQAASAGTDVAAIVRAAKDFKSIPKEMQEVVELYLLCKAAGG